LTATPSVGSSTGPYFGEDDLALANPRPLTALSVTVTVARTAGVAYQGQFSDYANGNLTYGHVDAAPIRYTFTLNAGITMVTGSYRFAAQFSGTGTPRVTSGDTWTVTSTSSSGTSTLSGTF
jgi:hypothetical protein